VANALEVYGLWKAYDVGVCGCSLRVRVLQGVSFRVAVGERLGIVGAAGAGKTTLIHCIAGLRRPDAGRVVLGGALDRTLLLLDENRLDSGDRRHRAESALLFAREAERLRGRVDRLLALRDGRLERASRSCAALIEGPAATRHVAEPRAPVPTGAAAGPLTVPVRDV
jgi:ATPase subunit of ABC transporter with duplicated ATPase domains